MALLASLFGALGRFAGRLLTSALGWASLLLFGRVPQQKQILLSLVTLGSLAWLITLVGVLVPDIGTLLLAAVPLPSWVNRDLVRLAMLVAAVVLPLIVGAATLLLMESGSRPHGSGLGLGILRGYPFSLLLGLTLIVLAFVATVRKVRAMAHRWEDAHVPVMVKPGRYDEVVRSLHDALDGAGLRLERRDAPATLTIPAKLLAKAAGSGVDRLVPDRLALLAARDVEVLAYPSDIAIQGSKRLVAAARAAVASRLTDAAAYLTTAAEAQAVEDEIDGVLDAVRRSKEGAAGADADARRRLAVVDQRLSSLTVAYEEWEVLYRMRLQAERDLVQAETAIGRGRANGRVPGRDAASVTWAEALAPALAFGLVVADVALAVYERIAPAAGAKSR